ncbi:MAG: glucose-6-phosphate dehydrogenase [Alphaproteobacteria bacterium]|nr:glucose-6-phosphate dehydrogenase [Alphaproteobacteria bacterium]
MSPKTVPVDPFDCVIFGGTGDLSLRKLLPALYHRDRDGQVPPTSRIFSISRKAMDAASYRRLVENRVGKHKTDQTSWDRFLGRLDHIALDAAGGADWSRLKSRLDEVPGQVRVFYLATAPALYGPVCARLGEAGLAAPEARVVVEKPIGHDLASAERINDEIGKVFAERQTYRIDHYLGKETVQNLIALRFANSLFEPLWSATWIDHVQITVAETVGLEGRADYYDTAGALRDMVQNHLLQLLCLVALEPPRTFDADAVRDEKIKVLRALEPIGEDEHAIIRGQYRRGASDGKAVPGYLEELGEGKASRTETFVALKVGIGNWRWAGVPFYLRTGKRLAARTSEIVIQFRQVPHSIFPRSAGGLEPNRLVIRLQPDEGITLHLMTKEPGPGGLRLKSVPLDLSFAEAFAGGRFPEAYERLLLDVVRGNPTLFMRRDEVEAAWTWLDGSIRAWEEGSNAPKPYTAGSWGPTAATALIERDGRTWHEAAA